MGMPGVLRGISVEDEVVTQKLMYRLALFFHTLKGMSLQSLEWIEMGLSLLWPAVSYKPHQCGQYLHFHNTNVDSLTPWSFYIDLFTLDPMWMLQKMSEGQHRASCSPSQEKSHLSVAGPAVDNPHIVALSQSHFYLEFVPLGWWWYTQPTQLIQPYKEECPLQEWWEKVGFNGGLVCILSAGSAQGTRGCHQWPGIPLHTVPPPTGPSLSSFPYRHWL